MKSYINLFEALQTETPKVKNRIPFMICLLALAAIFSVGFMGFTLLDEKIAQQTIDSLNQTLNSPSVKELMTEDEQLKREIISNQNDLVLLDEFGKYITSKKGFETKIYETANFAKPQNVTIKAISYSLFQMTISCESVIGNNPADFAKAIENTGVFEEVSYKGFVESIDQKTIAFTIVCTLSDESKNTAAKAETDETVS